MHFSLFRCHANHKFLEFFERLKTIFHHKQPLLSTTKNHNYANASSGHLMVTLFQSEQKQVLWYFDARCGRIHLSRWPRARAPFFCNEIFGIIYIPRRRSTHALVDPKSDIFGCGFFTRKIQRAHFFISRELLMRCAPRERNSLVSRSWEWSGGDIRFERECSPRAFQTKAHAPLILVDILRARVARCRISLALQKRYTWCGARAVNYSWAT